MPTATASAYCSTMPQLQIHASAPEPGHTVAFPVGQLGRGAYLPKTILPEGQEEATIGRDGFKIQCACS